MANGIVDEDALTDIADAIRAKNGGSDTYLPSEMAQAIEDLPSGGVVLADGTKLAYSTWSSIPGSYDFSQITIFASMFNSCRQLTSVPQIDTSKGASFSNMLASCSSLTSISQIDTSRGTDFTSMFSGCTMLTSVPQIDTSRGTSFSNMFRICRLLTSVPQIDTSKGTSFSNMFYDCRALTSVPQLNLANVRNASWDSMFYNCASLSDVSLDNILAGLAAITLSSSNKNLKNIGLTSAQATTCTTLSNWAAAQAAGWTTGY